MLKFMNLGEFSFVAATLTIVLAGCANSFTGDTPPTGKPELYYPEKALGALFVDVQTSGVFPDYKTFVDCTPKIEPGEILTMYEKQELYQDFNLKAFVMENFDLPPAINLPEVNIKTDMSEHLKSHWPYLTRSSGKAEGYTTLVSLPYPFVVPGGRFREMFYWDSYFTILGLLESDEDKLAFGMLKNFEHLIMRFGYIPNGNRTYFLSRSQPPFFAEMLRAYAKKHGMKAIMKFLPALELEYQFWTKERDEVNEIEKTKGHSVWFEQGVLNRYYGGYTQPRPEAYGKEFRWAQELPEDERPAYYRHLRAACESGWDFSSRWFADGAKKRTTHTENITPVCLNSLIYNMEKLLSEMYAFNGNEKKSKIYKDAALRRAGLMEVKFWSNQEKMYLDYIHSESRQSPVISIATIYPLYFGIPHQYVADAVAESVEKHFLYDGGVVTTQSQTGEQWDFPNGWAPLQWMTVMGLARYGHTDLAKEIAERWLSLNEKVFGSDQKMMEKYNVVDTSVIAGGGEYPNQDGFGWTNGVALALEAWLQRN